jgi:hypothetical protein
VSEVSQGPGWWLASDGRWYAPEQMPGHVPRSIPADATALPTASEPTWPPVAAGAGEAVPASESYPPAFGQQPTGPGSPTPESPTAAPPGTAPPYAYGADPGAPGVAAPPAYGYPPQQPPPYYPYAPSGYYPGGSGAYPMGTMVRPNQTNPLAVASLVCACVGIIPFLGIIGVVLGFVFGLVAKGQIKRNGGNQEGNGLATAGIIISAVITALWIVFWIVVATHTNNGVCTDANC